LTATTPAKAGEAPEDAGRRQLVIGIEKMRHQHRKERAGRGDDRHLHAGRVSEADIVEQILARGADEPEQRQLAEAAWRLADRLPRQRRIDEEDQPREEEPQSGEQHQRGRVRGGNGEQPVADLHRWHSAPPQEGAEQSDGDDDAAIGEGGGLGHGQVVGDLPGQGKGPTERDGPLPAVSMKGR